VDVVPGKVREADVDPGKAREAGADPVKAREADVDPGKVREADVDPGKAREAGAVWVSAAEALVRAEIAPVPAAVRQLRINKVFPALNKSARNAAKR